MLSVTMSLAEAVPAGLQRDVATVARRGGLTTPEVANNFHAAKDRPPHWTGRTAWYTLSARDLTPVRRIIGRFPRSCVASSQVSALQLAGRTVW